MHTQKAHAKATHEYRYKSVHIVVLEVRRHMGKNSAAKIADVTKR